MKIIYSALNCNAIKEGMVFDNWKKLCVALNLPYNRTDSRAKATYKKLMSRYFQFKNHEGSHKITITHVYPEPLPNEPTGKYTKYIEPLLMNILSVNLQKGSDTVEIYRSNEELILQLGMSATNLWDKVDFTDIERPEDIYIDFYRLDRECAVLSNSRLKQTLSNSLLSLQERHYIIWGKTFIVVKENKERRPATDAEHLFIVDIINKTLAEFDCGTIQEVFVKNIKNNGFYEKFTSATVAKAKKEGITYFKKVNRIVSNRNLIERRSNLLKHPENLHELNLTVLVSLLKSVANSYNKSWSGVTTADQRKQIHEEGDVAIGAPVEEIDICKQIIKKKIKLANN
ncbi:MAG: hypothetical protein Q8Q50_03530 [Methylobacter sp.]|nr:hypothetical protein [Methylobacter sp.]